MSETPTDSSARRLDGKALSQRLLEELGARVAAETAAGKPVPGLATVIVGEDPASQIYVRNKRRACEKVGMANIHHELAADVGQQALLALVAELNADPAVHGILVQLPLPKDHDYDEDEGARRPSSPAKDVDGFHYAQPSASSRPGDTADAFVPCTPEGLRCACMVEEHRRAEGSLRQGGRRRRPLEHRRQADGRPAAPAASTCHGHDLPLAAPADLADAVCRRADILVAAVGVGRTWSKGSLDQAEGAVVIDVGINRGEDGKLVGDVEYAAAAERASWITPVPGGVGPMTIAMLLDNTAEAALGPAS